MIKILLGCMEMCTEIPVFFTEVPFGFLELGVRIIHSAARGRKSVYKYLTVGRDREERG